MPFFFASRRRHTRFDCDWSSDVCSSDLLFQHILIRVPPNAAPPQQDKQRSEEHTSELQSQSNLVCRLLLEKKKTITTTLPASNRILIRNPTKATSSIVEPIHEPSCTAPS